METVGQRLKYARERAGFKSAADAASRFRWHEHNYRDHEGDRRGVTVENAGQYGAAFGVSPWWLLTGRRDILPIPDETAADYDYVAEIYQLFSAIRQKAKARSLHISEPEALYGAIWALAAGPDDFETDEALIQEAILYILDRARRGPHLAST